MLAVDAGIVDAGIVVPVDEGFSVPKDVFGSGELVLCVFWMVVRSGERVPHIYPIFEVDIAEQITWGNLEFVVISRHQ
jgi:hypothetical protein